jgi:hypothetical protein
MNLNMSAAGELMMRKFASLFLLLVIPALAQTGGLITTVAGAAVAG